MENFKFMRRQATEDEIVLAGFEILDGQAKSKKTGAFYKLENFLVANSATIEDVQKFGSFLYLDDDLPAAERVLVQLA